MEANELRIGNYLYPFKDQAHKVVGIVGNLIGLEFEFNMVIQDDIKNIEPIPLTEEWLIKFGFRPNKHGYIFDTFRVKNLVTGFFYGYIPVFLDGEEEDIEDVQIKYVHQLQNLYFALTGKELTIK